LPEDWHTVLMPEGKKLSKTIISKIILARCLVNFPKALLLEDIISWFETEEKEKFVKYLLNGNWTLVMISEDPETIKKFPRVIALNEGRLEFDGTPEEYLKGKSN
ncbi:MAG: ABC transporter ATP-binding protein, partial [Cyclobacteriaceae bacterium]|nr:ABC transporter ATP-binding protein [Cyclobacteriaceae bacterium]